jgi:bleomycin hydrolase
MRKIIATIALFGCLFNGFAQESGYNFTMVKQVKATPVKDQARTGTCWSFATTSFIESELLRMGKPEYDLSEMFFARYAYEEKAIRFVRYQGKANFGQGGQAHDVFNVMRRYGLATEEAYPGKNYGSDQHAHGELVNVLTAFVEEISKNPNRELSTAWFPAFSAVLDAYLGVKPTEVTIDGKKTTPLAFSQSLGVKPDDYIEITSFSHKPFYTIIDLEIADNWSHDRYYNIPLDDLIVVMRNALMNGYSFCWDGDVSEKGFGYSKGVAILPELRIAEMGDTDKARFVKLTETERLSQMLTFNEPTPEIKVTQELRQKNFDNLTTTDDHLMHVIGLATDQNGTTYFYTKNSWGTKDHKFGGYLYMSEPYVRMKTIAILVHRDAVPKEIASRMGLK